MADTALLERLRATVTGEVRGHEPLASYTTLRVGGPAAVLVRAESPEDLVAVAQACADLRRPWLIVGKGSNLLVADDGWPGVAVTLGRGFREVIVDDELVTAGGSEPMPALAHTAARHQLGGLSFGVAIPGTLGGAVRMNAGAHGHELHEILEWAEICELAHGGRSRRIQAAELGMRYRHTDLPPDAVVIRAGLRLRRTDPQQLAADMAEMKRWRRAHQPINEPSCGSVFRNPAGDSAGRLIEAAGCKGLRVGGARVSPVHANFITAGPEASAEDVYAVIRTVQEQVAARQGVDLQTEVVLAGFVNGRGDGS